MRFINWIKSLFKKQGSKPSAPVVPPISKGWDPYWGELIKRLVYSNIKTFDAASDIYNIRPDWASLSDEQKSVVMEAFFKALIYFESGYNPLSESVDVGTKGDKQTWSVGLMQLSGVDKANLGLQVGFDYEGLKNPENNIVQGIEIMLNQIRKRGKIIIYKGEKGNPGVYWATLNPGNKYDETAEIVGAAQAVKFEAESLPKTLINKEVLQEEATDFTPWMRIAHMELGVSESSNPRRVIEYHQATSLGAKDTATPWCSSFACWVLKQAGYKTTNSAWARDWLKYGDIADTQKGCIMVFERGTPGGSSHVGFYTGKQTSTQYEVLGGNQGDSVCLKMYSKKDLLGCRWPERA